MSDHTSAVEEIATSGFALIRNFAPGCGTLNAAQRLGEIDCVDGLEPVQTLVPRTLEESPPNTYSGNFGTSEFPLHTDLAHWATPPRYFHAAMHSGGADSCNEGSRRLRPDQCIWRRQFAENHRPAPPSAPLRNATAEAL